MSYLVALQGITAPVRYDGQAWISVQIAEAAVQGGPFTTLTTIALTPRDPDPSNPTPRSFTVTNATLSSGWYQVTFVDAAALSRPVPAIPYPQPAPEDPGYTTLQMVAARNAARVVSASSVPNIAQIQDYIVLTAGELNAILINKGYEVPVNSASNPEAGQLLQSLNTTGAWAMMEQAAPNSPNLDRAMKAWEAAKKMLSDASFVLDAPQDVLRSEPRGPWVTFQPTGQVFDPMFKTHHNDGRARNPYFSRSQQF